jgi:hypothetical protein
LTCAGDTTIVTTQIRPRLFTFKDSRRFSLRTRPVSGNIDTITTARQPDFDRAS